MNQTTPIVANLKNYKLYTGATIVLILGSLYLLIYDSPFKFIPSLYREFIFSPVVVTIIYMVDRAENGHLFKHLFSKPVSWKKEWKGAWKKWLISFILVAFVAFISKNLGLATPDLHKLNRIKSHPFILLIIYIEIWTAIAFGEEIIFRGFLMTRIRKIVGDQRIGNIFNILFTATLFGLFHHFQGYAGILSTFVGGLVLSVNYIYKKDNLWQNVMIHGLIDTTSITMIFLSGLHS